MWWFISLDVHLVLVVFGTPLVISLLMTYVARGPLHPLHRLIAWVAYVVWSYCWVAYQWNQARRTRESTFEELLLVYAITFWPLILMIMPAWFEFRRLRLRTRRGFPVILGEK